ncbi:collagen alpha-1(I) chain-like [Choloepus didactylus]|uniref:collagen alpha-1(I) chain-like n=1 Tax=Choloepus didactylus TaxID=27675 RepID=UPI0018A0FFAD|nr:collagen alpha-1(I) chain-like [Choloepus didactylus]
MWGCVMFAKREPPPLPKEKKNRSEEVARERPGGAGGSPRSEGPSREPCRAEGGPHSRRRHRHHPRRRVGWEGREPPPPPPPGWAPFAVDAGGPGRGKEGPGGGLGRRRPRLTCGRELGAPPRPRLTAPLREEEEGEGHGVGIRGHLWSVSPTGCPRSAPGGGPPSPGGLRPAAPRQPIAPLAAVCARIFVVVMRVDECEVFRAPAPEPGGCERWGAGDTGQSARAPRGHYGRIPGAGSPSAPGCSETMRLRGPGRGGWGVGAGPVGVCGPGPDRARPQSAGRPARRPRAQVKAGKEAKLEPFCFAGPALLAAPGSPAPSAASRGPGPPKSRAERAAGAGGRARAGAGPAGRFLRRAALRGHHFLLALRRQRRRPPRARPSRLSPPGPHFSGGSDQKKKFSRRGRMRARPGRRRRAAGTRRGAGTVGAPWPPPPPRRRTDCAAEGKRLSFSPGRSPQRPGASRGEARGSRGAPRPFSRRGAGGVAGRPQPHAAPRARRPRAGELGAVTAGRAETHRRAHTPSGGSLPARRRWSRTWSLRVRAVRAVFPREYFFPEAAQACVGSRDPPRLVVYRRDEDFLVETPSACSGERQLAVAYVVMPDFLALSGARGGGGLPGPARPAFGLPLAFPSGEGRGDWGRPARRPWLRCAWKGPCCVSRAENRGAPPSCQQGGPSVLLGFQGPKPAGETPPASWGPADPAAPPHLGAPGGPAPGILVHLVTPPLSLVYLEAPPPGAGVPGGSAPLPGVHGGPAPQRLEYLVAPPHLGAPGGSAPRRLGSPQVHLAGAPSPPHPRPVCLAGPALPKPPPRPQPRVPVPAGNAASCGHRAGLAFSLVNGAAPRRGKSLRADRNGPGPPVPTSSRLRCRRPLCGALLADRTREGDRAGRRGGLEPADPAQRNQGWWREASRQIAAALRPGQPGIRPLGGVCRGPSGRQNLGILLVPVER